MRRLNRKPRRASWVLAGLCLALGLLVLEQASSAPDVTEAVGRMVAGEVPAEPHDEQAIAEIPLIPPLERLSETVERPLFLASRRPPAPEAVPLRAARPIEAVNFGLVGVTLFDGQRIALLKPSRGGRIQRIREGQRLEGWRVTEIGPSAVLLRQADLSEELRLLDQPRARSERPPRPTAVEEEAVAPEASETSASEN